MSTELQTSEKEMLRKELANANVDVSGASEEVRHAGTACGSSGTACGSSVLLKPCCVCPCCCLEGRDVGTPPHLAAATLPLRLPGRAALLPAVRRPQPPTCAGHLQNNIGIPHQSLLLLTTALLHSLHHLHIPQVIYKIDIPANRYDMLCLEGIARALNIFLGREAPPAYRLADMSGAVLVWGVCCGRCGRCGHELLVASRCGPEWRQGVHKQTSRCQSGLCGSAGRLRLHLLLHTLVINVLPLPHCRPLQASRCSA